MTSNMSTMRPPRSFPFLRAGQLVLSMREPGALVALDHGQQQRSAGACCGAWVGQHDPDLLANGHILLFDNNGQYNGSGRSQVIEFDPQSGGITRRYARQSRNIRWKASSVPVSSAWRTATP